MTRSYYRTVVPFGLYRDTRGVHSPAVFCMHLFGRGLSEKSVQSV